MKKGIFIMSLNSKKLDIALQNNNNFYLKVKQEKLDVFVFDTFEILNGIFFNKKNAGDQKVIIDDIIKKLEYYFISSDIKKRELIRFSKIKKELNPYILEVYKEYYNNVTFERHCRNQIFQNLQPKLKKINIENNKSNLIELLLPFLIVEIAVYLFIYHKNYYTTIYGLENEMNIIESIKSDKYEAFSKYLTNKTEYTKLLIS